MPPFSPQGTTSALATGHPKGSVPFDGFDAALPSAGGPCREWKVIGLFPVLNHTLYALLKQLYAFLSEA